MNVASLLSKAYRITNTNATTFLDGNSANVLTDLNTCYGHRTLKILKVRQDINSQIKEVYLDFISIDGLVAGDLGYNGEYPFETDTLRPIRVEVSFDGLTWRPCEVYDIMENPNSEHKSDDINGTFSTSKPYVRFERDSYFIRPLNDKETVTAGIHIWYEKRQTTLTTGSPEFEDNLHDVLAYDLAEMELLMHPNRYSDQWRMDFRTKKAEVDALFDDFYKNRFKNNFRLRSRKESFK